MNGFKKKIRIDQLLVIRKMAENRQRAKALILAGKIFVNDERADKAGSLVHPDSRIRIYGTDMAYVSRGGIKLEAALDAYNVNVDGMICLDVGASTGGFSDCLLQRGAKQVLAVDVGYGQLAWKLRQDPRVVVIERSNIRYLPENALPFPVDLVTIDVSFISLKIVVPAVVKFMKLDAGIMALVKPQFEVGKESVGKGGVVKDGSLHRKVLDELADFFSKQNLHSKPAIPSPILGPKGNKEFFLFIHQAEI
jgi:23S rRNA (cytidine1920-2'-O)/16S rRNA (cytidine1409-2'-O)-methyltransferase